MNLFKNIKPAALAGSTAAALVAGLVAVAACHGGPSGTATAAGSAPAHVLTYQFFGVNGVPKGYPHVDPGTAAKWVSWAMSNPQNSRALHAAGIKVDFYTNPNRLTPHDKIAATDESEFAHDCSGKRILVTKGEEKYLTDPGSSSLLASWKSYINQEMSQGQFDGVFEDTTASTGSLSGLPCNFDENDWISKHVGLDAAVGVPVLINGLGDGDLPHSGKKEQAEYQMSPALGIVRKTSNVFGGTFEDCYASSRHTAAKGTGKTAGSYWEQTENTELAVAAIHKIFVCNESSDLQMEGAIDQRTFAEASFLLSYGLDSSMIRQQFKTPSEFNLGPEVELVAMDPVSASPASVDGLKTSTGAYGREYRSCYIAGSPVGPCATAVNSDFSGSHSFPFSGYGHTMVLQGSGILDGGTISTNGPAPSTLEPMTGEVAFR